MTDWKPVFSNLKVNFWPWRKQPAAITVWDYTDLENPRPITAIHIRPENSMAWVTFYTMVFGGLRFTIHLKNAKIEFSPILEVFSIYLHDNNDLVVVRADEFKPILQKVAYWAQSFS